MPNIRPWGYPIYTVKPNITLCFIVTSLGYVHKIFTYQSSIILCLIIHLVAVNLSYRKTNIFAIPLSYLVLRFTLSYYSPYDLQLLSFFLIITIKPSRTTLTFPFSLEKEWRFQFFPLHLPSQEVWFSYYNAKKLIYETFIARVSTDCYISGYHLGK